ncbi:KOW domain-containing RNA-binding protein [Tautonia sociabilis]|uniref:Right handed beta helix domain-containing protein n=1 Tax=Tautonia sociabilis TaxID=2080755 RepID=A0A432MMU4_9BACT|nr:hypothetical protein [Tautonia sociabilis]RUL88436.1 hypothetical protein TsocGM_06900 [Tautonia sociabilis]
MRAAISGWALAWLLVVGAEAEAAGPSQAGRLSARWLGQVGTDRVGRAMVPGPNGVQDMVIELRGLPASSEIVRAVVRGYGGDIWGYRDPGGHWAAELERETGSDRARLLLEPLHEESGRAFRVEVELPGGRLLETTVRGGTADPMVRMPEVQLAARWFGPDGSDRTSPGPSVGPDGFQDVRIDLARLDPGPNVNEVTIRVEGGPSWAFGPNPEGFGDASFVRSAEDRSRAMLFLSPEEGIQGRRVRIDLAYDNNTKDRTVIEAGPSPTGTPVAGRTLPRVAEEQARVRWLGPDRGGSGAVGIGVERRSAGKPRAVVLSDGVAGCWVFERPAGPRDRPIPYVGESRRRLDVAEGRGPGTLLLSFEPYRNLDGEEMTLRFIEEDGRSSVVRFEGGASDPIRRYEEPPARKVRVEPGDDLARIAAQGGTITVGKGVYRLDRPLDLNEPTHLIAEPGAELRFRQDDGDEPWGEAVAIRGKGRTRIEGLTIRFDGPVRWHQGAAWGGAVVGVSNLGKRPGGPVHLEMIGLDVEAPPASSEWEEAPNCLRLVDSDSGVVQGCSLKGGSIVLFNGPWRIEGNTHRGTRPGTFSGAFLSGRLTRDIAIVDNELKPEPNSGKLYRFLVLADRGVNVSVRGNRVIGVGARDDDDRPHPNAPEVLLTESYLVRFEGRHSGISDDGRILAIPEPQGEHPAVGEVVAVLSGPEAGRWAVIDQVLDRNVVLLDRPLPKGDYDVAITPGFLGTTIEENTIDCRGSTQAHPIVLTGNHYGTRVAANTLLGGANAFRISGYVCSQPIHYAWTHTPQFGFVIERNTIEDSSGGGLIAVHHGPRMKTNRGRVYLSGSVLDNTFRWTEDGPANAGREPVALTVGMAPSLDAGELVLTTGSNEALDARGRPLRDPMRIVVGTVNGKPYGPPRE